MRVIAKKFLFCRTLLIICEYTRLIAARRQVAAGNLLAASGI